MSHQLKTCECGEPTYSDKCGLCAAAPQQVGEPLTPVEPWVDVAIRGEMAKAVYAAIRRIVPALGPWNAFDAAEVQQMADALRPHMPWKPAAPGDHKIVPARATQEWKDRLAEMGYRPSNVIDDVLAAAPSMPTPLITKEDSLRFKLECTQEQLAEVERENAELRAALKGLRRPGLAARDARAQAHQKSEKSGEKTTGSTPK